MEAFSFRAWKRYKWLVLLILTVSGCNEIFEEDISNKQVVLIAPADSLVTAVNNLTFYWEEVQEATWYRVQIAQPGFNQLQTLVLDTPVTSLSFSQILGTGDYEWRVRAENGSSRTMYTTRFITIDSSSDLGMQTILLLSPTSGYMTNNTTISFEWSPVDAADQYSFMLKTPDWNGTLYGSEILIPNDTVQLTGLAEGQYDWGVRAENTFSSSAYSTRSVWVDITAPGTPTLTTPLAGASLGDSTNTLYWNRVTDSGTPLVDSLFIYTDTLMTNLLMKLETMNQYYSDSLGVGTYFWQVKTQDGAANESLYSELRKFTVN